MPEDVTENYDPAAHYDRVTDAWGLLLGDELHYGVFETGVESLSRATGNLTALMADYGQLENGNHVLDVGCGSGAPACAIAAEFGVSVLGITTSEVGIAEARDRARSQGLETVEFDKRDGTDNQLADESFDRVWVLESSHLMPDRAKLVAECARVLRPGGRLVLCDLIRRRDIPFLELRARRGEFAVLRAAFGSARMDPLSDYVDMARNVGLVVEKQRDLTSETRPTFELWRANLAAHRDRVVELIGAAGADDFGRSIEILERFWDDGTLGYGIIAARKAG